MKSQSIRFLKFSKSKTYYAAHIDRFQASKGLLSMILTLQVLILSLKVSHLSVLFRGQPENVYNSEMHECGEPYSISRRIRPVRRTAIKLWITSNSVASIKSEINEKFNFNIVHILLGYFFRRQWVTQTVILVLRFCNKWDNSRILNDYNKCLRIKPKALNHSKSSRVGLGSCVLLSGMSFLDR